MNNRTSKTTLHDTPCSDDEWERAGAIRVFGDLYRTFPIKRITAVYVLFLAGLEILADHYIRPWDLIPLGDKIAHFILIGVLCLLLNLSFGNAGFRVGRIRFLYGTLIVVFLSTVAEFSQVMIASRTYSFVDLCFGYFGAMVFGQLSVNLGDGNPIPKKL